MIKNFFSLTSQERKALIFLSAFFLFSLAISAFWPEKKHHFSENIPRQKALLIDINKASISELMQLPHIGYQTAKRIIAWRKQQGPFQKKEDLLKIKGIGPKKLKAVYAFIKVK